MANAGIETRSEGLRLLIQAAGGVFVPDARLAVEMACYRTSLNEVGNGVAQKGELPFPVMGKGGGGASASKMGGSAQSVGKGGMGAKSHEQDERSGEPQQVSSD